MVEKYLRYPVNYRGRPVLATAAFAMALSSVLFFQACKNTPDGPSAQDCRNPANPLFQFFNDGGAAGETKMTGDYNSGLAAGAALTPEDGRREGYEAGCTIAYNSGVSAGKVDQASVDAGYGVGYAAFFGEQATCDAADTRGLNDGFDVGIPHGEYRGYLYGYRDSGYFDFGFADGTAYGLDACSGAATAPAGLSKDQAFCYNLGFSAKYTGGKYAEGLAAGKTANTDYKNGIAAGKTQGQQDQVNCYQPGLTAGKQIARDNGYADGRAVALADTDEACYWVGYGTCQVVTEEDYRSPVNAPALVDVCQVASDGQTPAGATGGVLEGFLYGFNDPVRGYGEIIWNDQDAQTGFLGGTGGIGDGYMDGFDDGVCAAGCSMPYFGEGFCSFTTAQRAGKAFARTSQFGKDQVWALPAALGSKAIDGYRGNVSSTLPKSMRSAFEAKANAAVKAAAAKLPRPNRSAGK